MTAAATRGLARTGRLGLILLAFIASGGVAAGPAASQDDWDSFDELESRPPGRKTRRGARDRRNRLPPPLPPINGRPGRAEINAGRLPYRPPPGYGRNLPPLDEKSRAVESSDLAPLTNDAGRVGADRGFGSGLDTAPGFRSDQPGGSIGGFTADLWRGLDLKTTETLIAGLQVPPRSPALHVLWRRAWLTDATPPAQERSGAREGGVNRSIALNYFPALRLEALYRSGLVRDAARLVRSMNTQSDPLLAALKARIEIGFGDRKAGCAAVRTAIKPAAAMPKRLKGEALLAMGFCAAASGDAAAAGLAAELAREEGVRSPLAFAVLDAVASGRKPRLEAPDRLTLMDYRFLKLASSADPSGILATAEVALLSALALDKSSKPALRLAAGERASQLNAISAADLAAIYEAQSFAASDFADPTANSTNPARRRALIYQAIKSQRNPQRKARLMAGLLGEFRKDAAYMTLAQILAKQLAKIHVSRELSWFAEAATEIAAVAGDYELARQWAQSRHDLNGGGQNKLAHWLALIDIAQSRPSGPRGFDLPALEILARRGRFKSEDLHRLATVLDALEYNIPIPLWEAASATPQPKAGHLPETGVLARLKAAAARNEAGHTILLALRTIGPDGAAGAHMIALGDAIRALKIAGFEAYARRLGFEALIASWPRGITN